MPAHFQTHPHTNTYSLTLPHTLAPSPTCSLTYPHTDLTHLLMLPLNDCCKSKILLTISHLFLCLPTQCKTSVLPAMRRQVRNYKAFTVVLRVILTQIQSFTDILSRLTYLTKTEQWLTLTRHRTHVGYSFLPDARWCGPFVWCFFLMVKYFWEHKC
jgi:hypothetical protein